MEDKLTVAKYLHFSELDKDGEVELKVTEPEMEDNFIYLTADDMEAIIKFLKKQLELYGR